MYINRKNLELAMARKCMSIDNLSVLTGISVYSLTKLKNGMQKGRTKTIGLIAKALEVDVTEIIVDGAAATANKNNYDSRDNENQKGLKAMRKYSITTPEQLRELCISKNWFTCGSNRQYEKLFQENESGASVEEITLIIWLCSDSSFTKDAIRADLETEWERYGEALGELQVAEGERTADEIYCSYFD